eukprot:CAMPEP_0175077100 /NCGR_PEP_ID=MMETSP0052_2-20121109/23168_1 /TAXON_ID=51329 ORGANISM="Polytomella parva, Strain SAG 63-3" /NCGR_SAMPLE_ID=MMETSP0052_2 /ASSEMBLY_ACC=CAM_ASM_000194 /LENGTH=689 /DNA_ID=CAMNT_0016346459 /DNA_START=29 /DNA_END=2098 /DNA_ORIENTATION=-
MDDSVIALYEDPTSYFSHLNNRLGAKYVQMVKRGLYLAEGCAIVASAVHNIKPLLYDKCKKCNGAGVVICPYCKGRKNIPSTLTDYRISKSINTTDLAIAAGLDSSTACPFCGDGCSWDKEEEWINRWNEWSYRLSRLDFTRMPFLHNWTDAPDSSPNLVRAIGTPRIAPGAAETNGFSEPKSTRTSSKTSGPTNPLFAFLHQAFSNGSGIHSSSRLKASQAVDVNSSPYTNVRTELDRDSEIVQSSKLRFDHPYLYGKASFGLEFMYKQHLYPHGLFTKRRDSRSKFWDWFRILPPHLNPTVNQSLFSLSGSSAGAGGKGQSSSLSHDGRQGRNADSNSATDCTVSVTDTVTTPFSAASSGAVPSSSWHGAAASGGDTSVLLTEAAALRDEGRLEENLRAVTTGMPKPFVFHHTAGTVACPCCHGRPHRIHLNLSRLWDRISLSEKPIWAAALAEIQRRNWALDPDHPAIQIRKRNESNPSNYYSPDDLDPSTDNHRCRQSNSLTHSQHYHRFSHSDLIPPRSPSGSDPTSRLRSLHQPTLLDTVSGRSSASVEPYREELTKLIIAGPSARDALHFVPPPSSRLSKEPGNGVAAKSDEAEGRKMEGGKTEEEEEEMETAARKYALELKLQRDSLLRTNAYRGMLKTVGAGQPKFPSLEEVITAVNMVGQASSHGAGETGTTGGGGEGK